RVKGRLDDYSIKQVALLPMGNGNFIMALNTTIRKGIRKRKGAKLNVQLEADDAPIKLSAEFMECLADEPKAIFFFSKLPKSHQHYFSKWIESAKTEPTKAKRIAQSVNALSMKKDYGEMLRVLKNNRNELTG
ncbi:MAG: YdeI/OmpD-associated family protein, partial [Bacteroidota bacterium]|nr:YdeI/OmpD-associated family protein [Bacteroidota bacterium]